MHAERINASRKYEAAKQEEARIRAACGDSGSMTFYCPNGEVSQ